MEHIRTQEITPVGVIGTGSYLPRREVKNTEVGAPAGVDDEWIVRKTGIRSRRWADPEEATSALAVKAGHAALEWAGTSAADLSFVVVATSTPDSPQPPTATAVAERIGATSDTAAFDLTAVCSGFVFALSMTQRALGAAGGGYALVIGADVYSRILDPADRRTVVLFGDGAGAAVLGPVPHGQGVRATRLSSSGAHRDLVRVPAGGSRVPACEATLAGGEHYFRMGGRGVRDFVREHVPPAVRAFLKEAGVAETDVTHLVPHQANGHMIEDFAQDLGLATAWVHTTVHEYGNTGAASIPITLDAAVRSGDVRSGDTVLLTGFGGGMASGFALMRW